MVVGEILAGITLVNSAAEQIKKLVGNARDVSTLGKHIDDLLDGEQHINRSRMQKKGSLFSVDNIAQETINMKLAQERRDEIKQLLDKRFGHGTWAGILAERAKRIQAEKERQLALRKQQAAEREERMQTAAICLGIVVGAVMIVGFFVWVSRL